MCCVLRVTFNVLCVTFCVQRFMCCVLLVTKYVLCFKFYVLCFKCYVLFLRFAFVFNLNG